VRQAGAVRFKNFVKKHWQPDTEVDIISEQDRGQIKVHIVDLMLTSDKRIQSQLSEAVTLISDTDYPAKWPNLMTDLVAKMQCQDLNVIKGVFLTANAIFSRYPSQYKSDELFTEINHSVSAIADPLLQMFKMISGQVEANANNVEQLKVVLGLLGDMFNMVYSLCWQDIPQHFEDNMPFWCTEMHKYLTYTNQMLAQDETNNDEEAGPYSNLKESICKVINLLMEKFEEDFEKYIQQFVGVVWNMLTVTGLERRNDALVASGINFLMIVAKSTHHTIFANESILTQICEKIILPNMRLREDDEELFEDSPSEYIQMDIEGSDSDTRRRTACELVKGLCKNYEQQVTTCFTQYVNQLIAENAQNPAQNWKSKDAAIYLTIALSVKGSTYALGTTSTNQFVDIVSFFATHILPELQEPDVNNKPVLKADAIKFTQIFRNQLPKEGITAILPLMINHLRSNQYVVRSYAASCIERMLSSKDADPSGKMVPRYNAADIAPFLRDLIISLFGAVVMGMGGSDKWENEYVMKAITRVSGVAQADMAPYLMDVIAQLNTVLSAVCGNPRNPSFNHYMFETVASLIKFGCQAQPALAVEFEKVVMPPFQEVLAKDIEEFTPYVFQIFAQIISLRPQPLPEMYGALYQGILQGDNWERTGNIPALNTLLRTFVTKAPEIVTNHGIAPVLGVMQKLVGSKMNDHEGLALFSVLFENIPLAGLEQYLTQVFTILLTRLMKSPTVKYKHALMKTLSLYAAQHGAGSFMAKMESVQPGCFQQVLANVWLPEVQKLQNVNERKACGYAMVKLLEEPALQGQTELWSAILQAVMRLIELPAQKADDDGDQDFLHQEGYDNTYCKLHFANQTVDLAERLPDTRQALVQAGESLRKGMATIQQLPPDAQQKLGEYFQVAGLRLA